MGPLHQANRIHRAFMLWLCNVTDSMTDERMHQPESGRSLLAMGAFAMVGNSPLVVQPMIVGALVDQLGLTERQAGFIAASELCGLTGGILIMMPMVGRVPRSMIAVLAVALIVLANALTCLARDFELLLPLRFLSGAGAAAAFCVFVNMAAASRQPENAFAIVNAIAIAYSGVMNLIAPAILKQGGLASILIELSVISVLALATLPWLGRAPAAPEKSSGPSGGLSLALPVVPLLAMML